MYMNKIGGMIYMYVRAINFETLSFNILRI